MENQQAFDMICKALENITSGLSENVTLESHLTEDDIIDSLDAMNLLFELETLFGGKLNGIDEAFEDFSVTNLISVIEKDIK